MLVVWSPGAYRDIHDIDTYLSERDERTAHALVERIFETGDKLGQLPSGRPGRWRNTHEKRVPKSAYLLVYELARHEQQLYVLILRVVHMARHWPKGEPPPN